MSHRVRILVTALLILATVTIIVGFISISTLYRTAMDEVEERLVSTAQSQARLIEAVARFDKEHIDNNDPEGWKGATLAQIVDAHKNFPGIGATGELVLGRRDGDKIQFLLKQRHRDLRMTPISFDADWAEPMRRALHGESGTIVGLDYRGETVLAAYEPVSVLEMAIVAKMDLAEVSAPFVSAGISAGVWGALAVAVGAFFLVRRTGPMLARIEEGEARMQAILRSASDAILTIDESGTIRSFNRAAEEIFGHAADEMIGRNVSVLAPSPHGEAHDGYIQRYLSTGESQVVGTRRELAALRKNGEVFCADVHVSEVRFGGNRVFTAMIRDITDLTQTEEALHRSEAHFGRLLDSNIIGIITANVDGVVTNANGTVLQMLGYDRADVPFRWDEITPAEYRDLDLKAIAAISAKGVAAPWEKEFIRKDGSRVPVLIGAAEIEPGSGDCICFVLDLSDRKRLERQLSHAQKLESIGQLAAGVAHEINTPIQFVGDNTRFLKDSFVAMTSVLNDYARLHRAAREGSVTAAILAEIDATTEQADLEYLAEEIPKAIDQSLAGVERVTKIVRSMKAFSHPGGEEKQLVDLNAAIETTVTVARNEWKYVAELAMDLDPSLPLVPCHGGDINQVLLNMIVNAAHAIGEVGGDDTGKKGAITISTSHASGWAEIRINDSGCGMSEHVRSKIFDPFFTTKDVGKGTGQGLAISHDVIVKKHGGSIGVESQPGEGTTFAIRLPICPDDADADPVGATGHEAAHSVC